MAGKTKNYDIDQGKSEIWRLSASNKKREKEKKQ
jgi:hypothetical protein